MPCRGGTSTSPLSSSFKCKTHTLAGPAMIFFTNTITEHKKSAHGHFLNIPSTYHCYLLHYVFLHISSLHSFVDTLLSLSYTSNASSGPPKKKINLQSSTSAPQKCFIANFPTILYLDSKNTTT